MFRLFFFTTIFLLFSNVLSASDGRLHYTSHLTVPDGLSNNSVTCLLEDSRNYIWVGTFNGLNRYDGYRLKVFKNTFDKKIFARNRIRSIIEDPNQRKSIGTDDGVSVYDYKKERFETLYTNRFYDKDQKGPGILKIIEDVESRRVYCITARTEILVFDDKYQLVKKYKSPKGFFTEKMSFRDGIQLDFRNFLFTTTKGLVHFNTDNGKYVRIDNDNLEQAYSFTRYEDNKLLMTLHRGIVILSFSCIEKHVSFKKLFSGFRQFQFVTAAIGHENDLWLGASNKGVVHIDDMRALLEGGSYKKSFFTLRDEECRVRSILSTQTKGCWIGTFSQGLYKFRSPKNPFKYIEDRVDTNLNIYPDRAMALSSLDSSRIFVVTKRGKVNLFDTKNNTYTTDFLDLKQHKGRRVSDVLIDSRKDTWVRFDKDNLFRLRKKSQKFEKVVHPNLVSLNGYRSIKEDRYGNIWIHCLTNVYKLTITPNGDLLDCEALNKHPVFKSNMPFYVCDIYLDPSYDFLWVCTIHDGLYRMDLNLEGSLFNFETKQFLSDINNQASISNNFVTTAQRAPNGDLWVGTQGGGVCKVLNSNLNPSFVPFTKKHGLSNNDVSTILIDENNDLWLGTNHGLNQFNTKEKSFRKYQKEDGLPFEGFKLENVLLDNGVMIFMGNNGFVFFNKEELNLNRPLPALAFGDLKIFNNIIHPDDTIANRVILRQCLDDTKSIDLKYNENAFSIELTSLHFSNPSNYYLKYQLLPSSEEWVKIPSRQRNVNFSGLSAGKYTLKVMASNSLNEWTKPRELTIKISPPWWNTMELRIVYILLTIFIAYIVIGYRLKLIGLGHKLEIEQMERDKVSEISMAKLHYFSNISHEIKTPVTLISGPAAILAERFKGQPDVHGKLQLIQRQSKKIVQLINQVHDFQKSDAEVLKLNSTHFYFEELVKEAVENYDFMATSHGKILEVKTTEPNLYVFADKDMLGKVLNNLLSNSFKFTEAKDTITIEYKQEGVNLLFSVTDTGKGVDNLDLPHIFERFYQAKRKQHVNIGGSGIGLAFSKRLVDMHYGTIQADSEVDKGTKISVTLPIVKEASSEVELKREREVLNAEEKFDNNNTIIEVKQGTSFSANAEYSNSHVFLVEDNDDLRLFIENELGQHYTVTTFNDGKHCLEALENEWPDIIISDVLMPEINGLELCRKVKQDIKTSHIPVVLLTACTTLDDKLTGLKEGADSYITKPFEIEYLVSKIESILKARKQLRERFQLSMPLTRKQDDIVNGDVVFLEKLYELIEMNLNNPDVDIDSFAKKLFLNRTHFFQKVKALTDQTPYKLLKSYRIKRAANLLVQENMQINEVFWMTGFKSRPHFNRVFKEYFKLSPSDYIAKAKNETSNSKL